MPSDNQPSVTGQIDNRSNAPDNNNPHLSHEPENSGSGNKSAANADAGGKGSLAFMQKFSFRLPAVIVGGALAASVAVGVASYLDAKKGIFRAADHELTTVLDSRKAMLERYLKSIEQDLATQSSNPLVLEALDAFASAWRQLPGDPGKTLQKLYITDNPNPTGKKEELDFAPDGSAYSQAHKAYHPYIRKFLRERGYYDIFVFDTEGNLVYSVFKELDYATNLNKGKYKDTDLGNVFRAALKAAKPGSVSFFDFRPYAPSADAPASFIGTPLVDAAGTVKGVLAFQMPVDEMNGVMQDKAGLGETGQTYIVGRDNLMRSQGRFSKKPTILARKIETEEVKSALSGKAGVGDAVNERGQLTRIAYKHTDFHGSRWAFIAERTQEEISRPIDELRNNVLMVSVFAFIVIAAAGGFFARSLARPMTQLSGAMQLLADGKKETEIPGTGRGDEIGDMARTAGVFKNSMIEAERLQAEQREAEKQAAENEARRAEEKRAEEARAAEAQRAAEEQAASDRKQAMMDMADGFEKSVMSVVESLSSATTEMQSSAETMSATADQTNQQATAVAAASEEATTSVQTVASAAEELSASVDEISRQVAQSNEIAQNAVDQAKQTNEKVEGLAEAAQKIGEVVNLINDIASQTNLLALNATIEAARAGDAGKGFAVVASEVKSLATQTAKATEEIASQISAIQSATSESVEAIQGIGTTIGQLGDIAASVATAVTQQGSATREIAGSVQQAATGTQEVSSNITQVTQAAGETQSSSVQMLNAAQELAQQGDVLRGEVNKFLETVRAA